MGWVGFLVTCSLLQLIVIMFLVFQLHDNASSCRNMFQQDQQVVKQVSRLLIQANTQQHPLFAHENIVNALVVLTELINRHGGVSAAEKNLQLPFGKLQLLQSSVNQQMQNIQSSIMDHYILKQRPDLDSSLNDAAGISRRYMSDDLPTERGFANERGFATEPGFAADLGVSDEH